jgi:ATP-dependent Clp protease protease subunit
MKRWFEINNAAGTDEAEILVYGDIGGYGVDAQQFVKDLGEISASTIHCRVNSLGGDVFDGFAIYNALRRHPANVVTHVDGIAASAASYIALAGDEVRIARNGYLMIHNPWAIVAGDAQDLQSEAEVLNKLSASIAEIYCNQSGKSAAEVQAWMTAETWFSAQEAIDNGLADALDGESEAAPAEKPTNHTRQIFNSAKKFAAHARERVAALDLGDKLGGASTTKITDRRADRGAAIQNESHDERELRRFKQAAWDHPEWVDDFYRDRADYSEVIEANRKSALEMIRGGRGKYVNAATIESATTYAEIINAVKASIGREIEEYKQQIARAGPPRAPIATAKQITEAFADDPDFAWERLSIPATLAEHKLAHIPRLKQQLEDTKRQIARKLKLIERLQKSEWDPGEYTENYDPEKGQRKERMRKLLNMSKLGRAVRDDDL